MFPLKKLARKEVKFPDFGTGGIKLSRPSDAFIIASDND